MNRLLISAAHKSSGKTTLTLGLCAAFRKRGFAVQPFKKGPDYIDPMWLTLASGRACQNLDFYMMQAPEIRSSFLRYGADADLAIVEGNKGLYDGLDLDGSNSNAALARLLGLPVVLVIDARGMTRGIAPLILGYQAFDREINIAGVILNQLGGSRHESKLRAVIEHYTDIRVLGAVHHAEPMAMVERHLGLVPSNEAAGAQAKIDIIARLVAEQVDLDHVVAAAAAAAPFNLPDPAPAPAAIPQADIRIGYARDAAFAFYYPGDLDALRAAGAELVPFDTLRDTQLPEVDGVFIGGGFPETHMQSLEANSAMRDDLRREIDAGMPVYAECGGLMYLTRSLSWNGRRCAMVGALPADTVMHARPQGRGYVLLRETGNGPWPPATAAPGETRAHEFHYSSLENVDSGLRYAYEVVRGTGIDGRNDGIVYRNVLACYAHMRDLESNHWTARFVRFIREHRQNNGRKLRAAS
ncbi:MAG: cobyrinate a,c-diamide synthase [Acidiferrobacterales bacterium]